MQISCQNILLIKIYVVSLTQSEIQLYISLDFPEIKNSIKVPPLNKMNPQTDEKESVIYLVTLKNTNSKQVRLTYSQLCRANLNVQY